MSLVDPLKEGVKVASEASGETLTKDLGDLIGGQIQEAQLTGAFEEFVDREGFTEDDIEAIFDLAEGIKTVQVHGLSFPVRELGTQMKGPVIEAIFEHFGVQAVGCPLKGLGVGDSQKGIVLFSKGDSSLGQFGFHKVMAIDIIGGLERKEGTDSQDHGTQDSVADIEVVMGKTTTGLTKDGVIGIGGCKFGGDAAERGTLLHTFEDEVNAIAVSPLHLTEDGSNNLFFASVLFRPFNGDAMVGGIGFYPILVDTGPVHQDLFVNTGNADDLTEKVDDIFCTGEHGQITMDHDPVKAVVNEDQQGGIEFDKGFHRRSSLMI